MNYFYIFPQSTPQSWKPHPNQTRKNEIISYKKIRFFQTMQKFHERKMSWAMNEVIPQTEIVCFFQMESFRNKRLLAFTKQNNSAWRICLLSLNGIIPQAKIVHRQRMELFRRKKLHIFTDRNNSTTRNYTLSPNGIVPQVEIMCGRQTE